MKLDFTDGSLYINANPKKANCKKERKLVDVATKLMLDHEWLSLEDSHCGCDDEYEYYNQLCYDFDTDSRKDIMDAWKEVKKQAVKLCK